ncbi:conjugal transfer protein TraF [Thalassotalea sp. ND16A]|uniref:conjugal transfer protein TraF n=1 Tax=Thalassotalea sp. ND16A TaxID=1535422 RepID=UPI00051CECB2|nr:conjugal transfer protein TraF [Thalassotalea sp. ND16A]KGJ96050.1 hypothetical protein ND16A_1109 [Thalassotalea sp. ND16A]
MRLPYKLSLFATSFLLATSVQAEGFSAKQIGKGFTSISQDFLSSVSNPALLNRYDDDDDFAISIGVGGAMSDEYDVIDIGEDLNDQINDLDDDIDQIGNIPIEQLPEYLAGLDVQVDEIVAGLEEIDAKPVAARVGFTAFAIIPNDSLNLGLFIDAYGRLGMMVDYDEDDEQTLRNSIITGDLDLNDLKSNATGLGYVITDAGVMFGGKLFQNDDLVVNYGAKLKYQRIDLFYNQVSVAEFDEDEFDLTDDEFLQDDSSANADFGIHALWGDQQQWHFGLVVNNIVTHEVDLTAQDRSFKLEPTVSSGFSYHNDWLNVAIEADLIEHESFDELRAVQYLSTGVEFNAFEHAQLRFGYRTDINDNEEDVYTAGIGLSPWDTVFLDIGAFKGKDDLVGAAIQIGFKI